MSTETPLRKIRKQRGMTVEDVIAATKPRLSSATVYRADRGDQRPNPQTLAALAEALGVAVADLTHEPDATGAGGVVGLTHAENTEAPTASSARESAAGAR